ncbi:MAG: triose-phosphate isomerase [Planctomycetes bacterium]|nr:triose-phosphate isomerase [Planctomycetota bacterium]
MRRPLMAGNWKMNLDRRGAVELAQAVRRHAEHASKVDVALFPPFVYLDEVAKVLAGSPVALGAQNMCDEPSGAFTGEISAAMLRDVGCRLVLLGHSERRHVYGEGDALVARKLRAALAAGLDPVLCVGETLTERDANRTEEVVRRQTLAGLEGLEPRDMSRVTIAYEPVWAIGTGRNATARQAGEVHTFLRGVLAGRFDDGVAQTTRILYGGSVKPDNIRELMAAPGVDGALVGGAALKAASFNSIIDA